MFFCGMPIADVGPVAETIRPMRTWAEAPAAASARAAAAAMVARRDMDVLRIEGARNDEC